MVKKPTAKLSKVKANPVFVLVAGCRYIPSLQDGRVFHNHISHQGKTADLCCSENNQ